MEKVKKQRKIKGIVFDTLLYGGVFVLLFFALVCAIAHMNGSVFYLFGNRYDVVLTDSMSKKNEKYADFLDGHNDQYNPFDVVVSKEVTKPSQLKLYDVVIYKDRHIGINMHRIVDVLPDGYDELTLENVTIGSYEGYNGLQFNQINSDVITNEIGFKTLELTTFTTINDEADHFYFNVQGEDIYPYVTQKQVEGGVINTYTIKRKSSSPGKIVISHRREYDYSKEIITSLKIKATLGLIDINHDTALEVDGNNLFAKFNNTYKYEIRGDKASSSDGLYSLHEIQSKVVKGIPKMGYFIRFISSIWGGILFIMLAVLIIAFDIISSILEKREAKKAEAALLLDDAKEDTVMESKAENSSSKTLLIENSETESKVEEKPLEQAENGEVIIDDNKNIDNEGEEKDE